MLSCNASKDRKDGTLLYWSSNNGPEIEFTKYFVNQWNENNTTAIKFQPIPEGQSSEEVILASVVGKTTPDIYANMWQGSVEMYAKAGVLIPLDTLEGFTEFIKERCTEKVIEEITSSDGHIYQIPWKINPFMTIYNKRLVTDFGFTQLPNTYASYLEAGKAVKADKNNDGYVDQWVGNTSTRIIWYERLFNFYALYIAASDGASLIKNNKAAFNNEYAIGVFRFLQEIYRNEYFSIERLPAGQDMFLSEGIFTKWTGPWDITFVEKFKQRDDFEFGFFPMMVPENKKGPVYTYSDPKNMVIFNTCTQPQKAWEFIKTLIDKEGDKKLLEFTGQLPNRKNIETDSIFQEYFENNPKVKIFAKQANYIKGVDNSEYIIEVLDIISQEYEACVIYNKKTPEEAIRDAEKAVNVLLTGRKN
ncbi:MAG: extracellular solute-binding protein [Flavobacteriaceae bacterium]|nr:extracellular solute-binding protein [Flavobacteriaceae bacterium]